MSAEIEKETANAAVSLEPAIRNTARHWDFYSSEVERLQNPAEPTLRELADPANDKKWRPELVKTTFYAEGNTSVVVVQDRPGKYSVKQCVNNPSALIKGQLNISRTIASATISVAGAMAGLPIPGSIFEKAGAATNSSSPGNEKPAVAAGAQKVRYQAELRHRQNAQRVFVGKMTELQGNVAALGQRPAASGTPQTDWDAKYAKLKVEIIALLESQKRFFTGAVENAGSGNVTPPPATPPGGGGRRAGSPPAPAAAATPAAPAGVAAAAAASAATPPPPPAVSTPVPAASAASSAETSNSGPLVITDSPIVPSLQRKGVIEAPAEALREAPTEAPERAKLKPSTE